MRLPEPVTPKETVDEPGVDVAVKVTVVAVTAAPKAKVTVGFVKLPIVVEGVIVTVWPAYCGGRLTVTVTVTTWPTYTFEGRPVMVIVSSARTSVVSALGGA